jgi:hypothetical protein
MGTIIVLQKNQILDEAMDGTCTYENYVDSVYLVKQNNFNFDMEFGRYQADLFMKNGVEMEVQPDGSLFLTLKIESSNERVKRSRLWRKIREEFKKELSSDYFINEVLTAEKLNFTTHLHEE